MYNYTKEPLLHRNLSLYVCNFCHADDRKHLLNSQVSLVSQEMLPIVSMTNQSLIKSFHYSVIIHYRLVFVFLIVNGAHTSAGQQSPPTNTIGQQPPAGQVPTVAV
jgi:hypothetical protein